MKEEGRVIKKNKDSAIIEIMPHEECTKCHSCGVSRARQITASGDQAEGLEEGDHVIVEMDSSVMMKLYLLLYGAPLATFVAVVLVLYALLGSPLASFIGALLATVGTYIASGFFIKRTPGLSPVITAKPQP